MRDRQKHGALAAALYGIKGVVVAFDQQGIDNEGGTLMNVMITSDGRRFIDDGDVVDRYLVHGSVTLADVLHQVRLKLGLPVLLN